MMLFYLAIILFVLMAFAGGDRGSKSFFVLLFHFGIGMVSLFLIASAFHPMLVLFASSIIFTSVTIFYQNGFSLKTVTSMFSVVGVLLILILFIYLTVVHSHITGFNEIEMQSDNAAYLGADLRLSMFQILIISMIWAQLGALIDTSIAISSSMQELFVHEPQMKRSALLARGMNVGGDILGTMVNTLVFVGLGESLMLAFYYLNYQYTIARILNSKSFFQAVSGVIISCIGCTMIIPVTAAAFTLLAHSEKVQNFFSVHKGKIS